MDLLSFQAKNQRIQILDANFHPKNFPGPKLHITVHFFCQSKRKGHFYTLDLSFSTFWWKQIHFGLLNLLDFIKYFSNLNWIKSLIFHMIFLQPRFSTSQWQTPRKYGCPTLSSVMKKRVGFTTFWCPTCTSESSPMAMSFIVSGKVMRVRSNTFCDPFIQKHFKLGYLQASILTLITLSIRWLHYSLESIIQFTQPLRLLLSKV